MQTIEGREGGLKGAKGDKGKLKGRQHHDRFFILGEKISCFVK